MRGRKKGITGLVLLLLAVVFASCSVVESKQEHKKVGFVIVSAEYIPQRLMELIEGKKEEVMKLTYVDEGSRYIVVGYGRQKGGGYSISVRDVYETKNALYVDTCLIGPKEKQEKGETQSCPYLVLKTSQLGLPVVFQ